MQKQINYANWLILLGVILLLIGSFTWMKPVTPETPVIPTATEIAAQIKIPSVPTAGEIANAIVIPDNTKDLTDIIEGVYPKKVSDLENDCIDGLQDEFSEDDVYDMLTDLIEDYENEDIEDLNIITMNYDDDYEFDVLDLGLDNEEDRSARITSTLRVEYRLEDGNDDKIKDKVYATATCNDWDSEDDEFNDLDLELNL